ncbi:hypothetical protein AMR42_02755 [Limnothrix sp. PR1529]|nr:hypothetical protein BCR12_08010 [Limnothrix sp. P13C2]PIB15060.1 hypothetical protein AMR42_02755 [Limnothrix sp. PR1529]
MVLNHNFQDSDAQQDCEGRYLWQQTFRNEIELQTNGLFNWLIQFPQWLASCLKDRIKSASQSN